jgi:hypothetical protein
MTMADEYLSGDGDGDDGEMNANIWSARQSSSAGRSRGGTAAKHSAIMASCMFIPDNTTQQSQTPMLCPS